MKNYSCSRCKEEISGSFDNIDYSDIIVNEYGFPIGLGVIKDGQPTYLHIGCLDGIVNLDNELGEDNE